MFDLAVANMERRHRRVRLELHPDLRIRVEHLIDDSGGLVWMWEGQRGELAQKAALDNGRSNAGFGDSPHNYALALAVDVVLDPRKVRVRANPGDARYPDLWDNESADAVAAWAEVHRLARARGLERVWIGHGRSRRPDHPHLQLPRWRQYVADGRAVLIQ